MRPEELERDLGARLRELRIDQRLTQAELAERANISLGAVKHLEGGHGSTLSTLTRVLHALGQEAWIDRLGPSSAFNPMELLGEKPQRRPKRVYHATGRPKAARTEDGRYRGPSGRGAP